MLQFPTWVGGGAVHWKSNPGMKAVYPGRDGKFTLDIAAEVSGG